MANHQDTTDVVRNARAATLLACLRERGTVRGDAAPLIAGAANGWMRKQIMMVARDLVSEETVWLTTTPDKVHTITRAGGAR